MPARLPLPRYLDRLTDDAAAFIDLVADPATDLQLPVAACPGWSVFDLAEHLGGVHRWAAHALRENEQGPWGATAPREQPALAGWLREGADEVLTLLTHIDPTQPRWGFGEPPRLASFWWRRQAHELAIHLWDARQALGRPVPMDAGLAADGVDEVVNMFFPRQVRLGRLAPLETTITLAATDVGDLGSDLRSDLGSAAGPDLADLGSTGATWALGGAGAGNAPSATVRGTAEALNLLLWHRVPLHHPGIEVDGDPEAAATVLAAALTP